MIVLMIIVLTGWGSTTTAETLSLPLIMGRPGPGAIQSQIQGGSLVISGIALHVMKVRININR